MRVAVVDPDAFGTLNPLNVIAYLKAHGWERYSDTPGAYSVWTTRNGAELVVPYRRDAPDFATVLGQALRELEKVEDRSQLDLLRDLLNSGFDVVRLSAKSTETADGSIGLPEGAQLVAHAKDMMLASACATIQPRAVYHSRKPQQATDYLSSARLGQTEHGSFVLTILSPVAPQLSAASDTSLFPEEPFERQVVLKLTSSVKRAIEAATEAAATGSFDPLRNAVGAGVSANLCEAISGLVEMGDANEVDLSVAWSQNRPFPQSAVSRVSIARDVIPAIAEAARLFRSQDTLERYTIEGPVIKLERADEAADGKATVLASVEGTARRVVLTLAADDYGKATQAHKDFRPVRVTGDIKREGRTLMMLSPMSLQAIEADDGVDIFS